LADMGRHSNLMERLNNFKNEKRLFSDRGTHKLDKSKTKVMFGNCSKVATSWIAGPTTDLKKQFVPGYTGFVRGLISENFHGGNFADCTSKAIYRKPQGYD